MNLIEDPLEACGRLKSATIYRNSEQNYIYVCYHCECSFTNIVDTLSHVESHFDTKFEAKVNMTNENLSFESIMDNNATGVTLMGNVKSDPYSLDYEFSIVEQKHQHQGDHAEISFNEIANESLLSQCRLCDQRFVSAPLLIIHMIHDHCNMPMLTCPECFQTWTDESAFSSHLQQHIDINDTTYERLLERIEQKSEGTVNIEIEPCPRKFSNFFDCKKCDRKIKGQFAFHAHQYGHLINETHMDDKYLQESLKEYLDENVLCDESVPGEPMYRCKICNQISVKSQSSARSHIKQQHIYLIGSYDQKRFACKYCDRRFALFNNLKVHERTHTVHKPFKALACKTCDICSATFGTKRQIMAHMRRRHISRKPNVKSRFFDCKQCDRKIEGTFAFHAHQYGHLTNDNQMNDGILQESLKEYLDENVLCDESVPDEPTYRCKICNQISVKSHASARSHIKQQHIHLIETNTQKRYACKYCDRKFSSSTNSKTHENTHTKIKPYKCLVCNKSFAQSNYMRYHEKIHLGLQPHQCSICGRTFRARNALNTHIKRHANITKKCPVCDKELRAHRMSQHIRDVHENSHRPYNCTICSQAFKTSQTLKTHMYRHSDEKKYECRHHCKEKFISSSGRRAHERSKHEAQ